jgi:flavin reductase (DIM6/NTAB) family NADH-FMN oxidoreductase RutF
MGREQLHTGLDFIMLPRPVVLVTCLDKDDKPNIITIGWASPVSHKPLVVAIAISPRRYSHDLIVQRGEFVVNFPDLSMGEGSNWCGRKSGRKFDKFAHTGWTAEPSECVKTPRIKECYAALECKVINSIKIGDHTTFFGEVLGAYVDPGTYEFVKRGGPPDKIFKPEMVKTLQHLGGDIYITHRDDYEEYAVSGPVDIDNVNT